MIIIASHRGAVWSPKSTSSEGLEQCLVHSLLSAFQSYLFLIRTCSGQFCWQRSTPRWTRTSRIRDGFQVGLGGKRLGDEQRIHKRNQKGWRLKVQGGAISENIACSRSTMFKARLCKGIPWKLNGESRISVKDAFFLSSLRTQIILLRMASFQRRNPKIYIKLDLTFSPSSVLSSWCCT